MLFYTTCHILQLIFHCFQHIIRLNLLFKIISNITINTTFRSIDNLIFDDFSYICVF